MARAATVTVVPSSGEPASPLLVIVPVSVSIAIVHGQSAMAAGSVNTMAVSWALKQSRKLSSTTCSPRDDRLGMPSPLRKTASERANASFHVSELISSPDGVNQPMSRSSVS